MGHKTRKRQKRNIQARKYEKPLGRDRYRQEDNIKPDRK